MAADPIDMKGFIARVHQMAAIRGMTINALNERAKLGRGHLPHLLAGDRQDFSVRTLLAIARTLRTSMDWLLTGAGPLEAHGDATPNKLSSSEPLQERTAQRMERLGTEFLREQAQAKKKKKGA